MQITDDQTQDRPNASVLLLNLLCRLGIIALRPQHNFPRRPEMVAFDRLNVQSGLLHHCSNVLVPPASVAVRVPGSKSIEEVVQPTIVSLSMFQQENTAAKHSWSSWLLAQFANGAQKTHRISHRA